MILQKFLIIAPLIFLFVSLANMFAGKYLPGKGKFLNVALLFYTAVLSLIGLAMYAGNKFKLPYNVNFSLMEIAGFKISTSFSLDIFSLVLIFLLSVLMLFSEIFTANILKASLWGKRYSAYFGFGFFALYMLVISGNILIMYICLEILAFTVFGILSIQDNKDASGGPSSEDWVCIVFSNILMMTGLMNLFYCAGTFNLEMIAFQVNSGLLTGNCLYYPALFIALSVMARMGIYPFYQLQYSLLRKSEAFSGIMIVFAFLGASLVFLYKSGIILMSSGGVARIIWVVGLANIFICSISALLSFDLKRSASYIMGSYAGLFLFAYGLICSECLPFLLYLFFAVFLAFYMVLYSVMLIFGSADISEMGGLAKRMPFSAIIFFVLSLVLSFFPFLPYNLGARQIMGRLFVQSQPLMWLFLAGIFFMAAAAARLCVILFFGSSRNIKMFEKTIDPPFIMSVPSILSTASIFIAGYFLSMNGMLEKIVSDSAYHFKHYRSAVFGLNNHVYIFLVMASVLGIVFGWVVASKIGWKRMRRADITGYVTASYNSFFERFFKSILILFKNAAVFFEQKLFVLNFIRTLRSLNAACFDSLRDMDSRLYAATARRISMSANLFKLLYSGRVSNYLLAVFALLSAILLIELLSG